MSDKKFYAEFASAAYADMNDAPSELNGFQLIEATRRVKVYRNAEKTLIAIRGTKPSKVNDLKADVGIFFNRLSQSTVYRNVKAAVDKYIRMGGVLEITGHSLGGAITMQLLRDYPDGISKAVAFNPGVSPMSYFDVCFTSKCKRGKAALRRKLTIWTTGIDPISILSLLRHPENVSISAPRNLDVHGIANFTGGYVDLMHMDPVRGAGVSLIKPRLKPMNKDNRLRRNKSIVFNTPVSYTENTSIQKPLFRYEAVQKPLYYNDHGGSIIANSMTYHRQGLQAAGKLNTRSRIKK